MTAIVSEGHAASNFTIEQ